MIRRGQVFPAPDTTGIGASGDMYWATRPAYFSRAGHEPAIYRVRHRG